MSTGPGTLRPPRSCCTASNQSTTCAHNCPAPACPARPPPSSAGLIPIHRDRTLSLEVKDPLRCPGTPRRPVGRVRAAARRWPPGPPPPFGCSTRLRPRDSGGRSAARPRARCRTPRAAILPAQLQPSRGSGATFAAANVRLLRCCVPTVVCQRWSRHRPRTSPFRSPHWLLAVLDLTTAGSAPWWRGAHRPLPPCPGDRTGGVCVQDPGGAAAWCDQLVSAEHGVICMPRSS